MAKEVGDWQCRVHLLSEPPEFGPRTCKSGSFVAGIWVLNCGTGERVALRPRGGDMWCGGVSICEGGSKQRHSIILEGSGQSAFCRIYKWKQVDVRGNSSFSWINLGQQVLPWLGTGVETAVTSGERRCEGNSVMKD
ncbi:hypothetical protein GWK47_047413 [Chionoecetes opilio]|uniref:Uncharacterized protein n=1 Tax=Chionoecetes opilio TaxID=41210 RepID=A0A8J5CVE6_CHIOP|nr:hypothetical protein GWK47_047413 [Chionoecetes opilio]